MTPALDLRSDFARQAAHWRAAAGRLADPEAVAPPQAWQSLEHYLGIALRQMLAGVVSRLERLACETDAFVRTAPAATPPDALQARLVELRRAYLRAETIVDFYADVLATRAVPRLGTLLRACDHIATRSMAEALTPLGRDTPAALTYIDQGLGASILKHGLRLHDGTATNVTATIKITRHALLRPSAIFHECGHQVAFSVGWHPQALDALRARLGTGDVADYWASTVSEICADAFAHVHAGFAATAALHDVLDGTDADVFRLLPGDPHPVSYVRVLMCAQMCRRSFGAGPWDRLAAAWTLKHPLERCPPETRALVEHAVRTLPEVVECLLYTPYAAFGGAPLTRLIDPDRVSPGALARLERDAGAAAFQSAYWAWNESSRLVATTGLRAGTDASLYLAAVAGQEAWMLRLGKSHAVQ